KTNTHMATHRDRGRNQREYIHPQACHDPGRAGRNTLQQLDISFQRPSFRRKTERERRGEHEPIDRGRRPRMPPMEHRAVSYKTRLIAGVRGMKLMLLGLLHLVFEKAGRISVDRSIVIVAWRGCAIGEPEIYRTGIEEAPFRETAAAHLHDSRVALLPIGAIRRWHGRPVNTPIHLPPP